MSEPALVLEARRLRAARGVVVARDVSLTAAAGRVEGRELGRAFAAHAGGRARAHLATDLGLVPFAVVLTTAAVVWPLVTQGEHPHPGPLVAQMAGVQLAAAVFGAGLGSLVALIERAGWRLLVTVLVFLGLVVIRHTPLTPLLRLSTNPLHGSIAGPVAWLAVPGAVLIAVACLTVTRLT